jgi:hypothetical protein
MLRKLSNQHTLAKRYEYSAPLIPNSTIQHSHQFHPPSFLSVVFLWSSAVFTHFRVYIPHNPNLIFSYTLLHLFIPDIYIPMPLWTYNLLASNESICYISAALLSSVDNSIFLVLQSHVFTLGQLIISQSILILSSNVTACFKENPRHF